MWLRTLNYEEENQQSSFFTAALSAAGIQVAKVAIVVDTSGTLLCILITKI